MGKRVFISYDFSDKKPRKTVEKWLKKHQFEVIAVREEELVPEPDSEGEKRLRGQINECFAMLVLVGDNTHDRPWVDYEVKVAQSKQKLVRWVRIPDRRGSAPKEIRNQKPVGYSEEAILRALR